MARLVYLAAEVPRKDCGSADVPLFGVNPRLNVAGYTFLRLQTGTAEPEKPGRRRSPCAHPGLLV